MVDHTWINGPPPLAAKDWKPEPRHTTTLAREIEKWCSSDVMTGTFTDGRDVEIATLKRELESARYEAGQAQKLALMAKVERDLAVSERNMALQALADMIHHFINAPVPAVEESPAVRAVRVMQSHGVR